MRELRYSPDQPRDSHGRFGEGFSEGFVDHQKVYGHTVEMPPMRTKAVQNAANALDRGEGDRQNVSTSDLIPTQEYISTDKALGIADKWSSKKADVAILRVDGKNYIWDGHHTVAAAINVGESTVNARVISVSSAPKNKRALRYSPDQPRDSHGRFGEGSVDSVDKKTSVISEQGWIKSDGTFDPLQSGERPGTFGSQQFVEHHTEAAERLGLVKEKNMASQYVYDKAFATGAIRVAMANGVTLLESGKDFESSSAKEKMLNALDRISTDKVSIDFGRGANRPSFEGSVKDAKQWVKTGKEPSRLSKFRSLCYRPSIEHRWAEIDPLDIKETVLEGTDESPVTILLLRHGQTKSDANNEFCGWTDEDMDAEGLASVEEAAEEVLSRLTFTRVFSDDLQRTYHTAEVGLKYATGATEVIVNQGARTWDVGDLAGQKKTPETLAEKQYYVDHPKKVPPGSEECLKESKQRWMQFLLYVAAVTPPGETSLVACHSSNFKTTSQAIDQKIKVWPSGIVRLTITAQGITAEVLRKGAVEQAYADDRERMKVLAAEFRFVPGRGIERR